MTTTLLTEALYDELKQENYKYLVLKRSEHHKDVEVYEPVKELPNHFVIKMNSIEDETILTSLKRKQILIDY